MPAAWCEPLSFLQRITENWMYCDLILKASNPQISTTPEKRMEYIATFAVTSIAANIDRLSKNFNPLLGETYESIREDLGFRSVCEQVSHHPPITAFHVEATDKNNDWEFSGSINPKIKFWGKSIEVTPTGLVTLELKNFNETYTWSSAQCCVHNIIVGKLWFEYYGTVEIVCHQTGYRTVINFKPYSWSNKELHKFDGYIYDNKKNKVKALFGYWTHCVFMCEPTAYDAYIKKSKNILPTIKVDENYNEVPSKTSDNFIRANHSFSDINSSKNVLKRNEASSTAFLGNHLPILTDCTLMWKANPRPSYSAEVG
jgi:oxysterol-binding protein-related protein 1/2